MRAIKLIEWSATWSGEDREDPRVIRMRDERSVKTNGGGDGFGQGPVATLD